MEHLVNNSYGKINIGKFTSGTIVNVQNVFHKLTAIFFTGISEEMTLSRFVCIFST